MKTKDCRRIIFSHGFVTLFVLQALVFVAGFSSLIVYQVHRLRDASVCRLQALSEKSMLKSAIPYLLTYLREHSRNDFLLPMQLKIRCKYFEKALLIELISDDGLAVVFKLTILREHMRPGSWAYFFAERNDKQSDVFVYRGMQFGAAL